MMSPRSRRALLIAIISCLGVLSVPARDAAAAEHSWTDSSGQFSVEAGLVEFDEATGTVVLEKADGAVIRVPLAKLSAESQAQARRLAMQSVAVAASDFPHGFAPQAVAYQVPEGTTAFDRPRNILIANPARGLAVVTHSRDRGTGTSVWCDLKNGRLVPPPFEYPRENFIIEAISPDGRQLVAREPVNGIEPDRLSLWRVGDGGLKEIRQWVPFENDPRHVERVVWCNSRYLFLVSDKEAAYLLDLRGFKVAARFGQGAQYALSSDGKSIAFMRPDCIAFFSLETAQPIGKVDIPRDDAPDQPSRAGRCGGAFSPDGQRFAFFRDDNVLRLIDWPEGTISDEIPMPNIVGMTSARIVYWYEAGLVVLNNRVLIDVEERKLLQEYQAAPTNAHEVTYFDGYLFYPYADQFGKEPRLCLFKFPSQAEAQHLGVSLDDLYLYAPGTPTSLDVSGCEIPELDQADIAAKIRESNSAITFTAPGEAANFRYVVSITVGPAKDFEYTQRTTIDRDPIRGTPLEIVRYTRERKTFKAPRTYMVHQALYFDDKKVHASFLSYPRSKSFELDEDGESWFREQMRPKLDWFRFPLRWFILSDAYKSRVESYRFQDGRAVRRTGSL